MTRLNGFADLLIPDDCGRRALDETLADWREERAKGESVFARVAVDVRASIAIARVCAMVTARGLGRVDVWRGFLWTVVAAAAVATVQVFASTRTWPMSDVRWFLIPASVMVVTVLAAPFGLGLKRSHAIPGLTLGVLLVLFSGLLVSYVMPAANRAFRDRVWIDAGGEPARTPPHGLAEQDASELLRRAMGRDENVARRMFLIRLGIVLSPAPLLLLGAAVRSRLPQKWWWPAIQLAGGVIAVGLAIGAAFGGPPLLGAVFDLGRGREVYAPWSAIALCLVATLLLSRRSHNLNQEPGT